MHRSSLGRVFIAKPTTSRAAAPRWLSGGVFGRREDLSFHRAVKPFQGLCGGAILLTRRVGHRFHAPGKILREAGMRRVVILVIQAE